MPRIDLDAYVAVHAEDWARLEHLVRNPRRDGAASDDLVDTYQRVATHLSVVRTAAPDAALVSYLSSLLVNARIAMVGTRVTRWEAASRFYTHRFPAALYRLRWWWLSTLVVNVVVTGVMMWWFLDHPQVEQSLMTPQQVDDLVNTSFESYYSENPATSFASRVWLNNTWVAAQAIVFGITGFMVVYVLFQNVLNLAVIGSIMIRHDRGELFWGLILPHGLLELTAIFVAAGVGFKLFWSWVDPGGTSRVQSIARTGRTVITVALGLGTVLLISGIIEAFVTPSPLPTWARVGIGIVAEVLFLLYVFVVGRAAARQGETGDLDASLLEDRVASQA